MKLYVVGVGPGDPELITLKGRKALEEAPVVFCPSTKGHSRALEIIRGFLKGQKVVLLEFPMKAQNPKVHLTKASEVILKELERFKTGTYVTLGDPSLYCTFFWIYDHLREKVSVEIIPGVSSFTAAACAIPLPLVLGEEKLALIPVLYCENLSTYINDFDTLVFLKVKGKIKDLKEFIDVDRYRVFYIKRATLPEQKIWEGLEALEDNDEDYLSLVVVKKCRS
ncbi:MAG: precorrin-2 C(20)-methyltransferase [Candidatus Bathyarchaeia archaeon]